MTWCLFLGLLAAPRLFFSGLCSLFPWAGFSKRGTHPRWCWRGPDPGQSGRGAKGRARGRPLCVPEKALRHLGAAGPRPNPTGSKISYTPWSQRVGWKIRKQMIKKSSRCTFFLWGIPVKCAEIANFLCCFPGPPKKNELPCFCLSPIPVWMGEVGESCCQPRVPSFPLRDSASDNPGLSIQTPVFRVGSPSN